MSLDYPRGWELARAAPAEAHHPGCSFAVSSGALLCDLVCPVIRDSAEFTCPALHGRGGIVLDGQAPYGPCPGHLRAGEAGQ